MTSNHQEIQNAERTDNHISSGAVEAESAPRYELYNYFRSSASYRVRIALHLKQIEFDYHAVHLLNAGGEQLQDWYENLNPIRQVPTLVRRAVSNYLSSDKLSKSSSNVAVQSGHQSAHQTVHQTAPQAAPNSVPDTAPDAPPDTAPDAAPVVIAQSMAILDYLDQCHPERALFPRDANLRAQCIQICEIINSGMQPLFNLRTLNELTNMFGATQDQKNEWTKMWICEGLSALERLIEPLANKFCLGDMVTAADCFLIPQLFAADRFGVTLEKCPTLHRIRANCEAMPEFKAASPFRQVDTPADLRID